jgi:hypothetical protein
LADLVDLMAPRWTSFKGITVPLIWESVRTSIIYLTITMTPTLNIAISILVPVQSRNWAHGRGTQVIDVVQRRCVDHPREEPTRS